MATTDLTEETFGPTLSDNAIVLVDFWASWCAPCLRFAPVFERASQAHPDIVFAKVDTEAQRRLARQAGIRAIPTLMAFRDRVLLYSESGALSAAELERLISTVREIDMEDVHARLAARRAVETA